MPDASDYAPGGAMMAAAIERLTSELALVRKQLDELREAWNEAPWDLIPAPCARVDVHSGHRFVTKLKGAYWCRGVDPVKLWQPEEVNDGDDAPTPR